ncbi:MAG: hypothetical protein L0I29_12575 [Hyphomicrobiales bacterium]|nr:hypothetical protein [Hyphomicrobiales bacterium]
MVKTPRARHSSRKKEPVTIELGPDQVSRLADSAGTPEEAMAAYGASDNDAATTTSASSPDPDEAVKTKETEENSDPDASPGRTDPSASASYYGADGANSPAAEAEAAPVPPPASSGGFGRPLAAGIAGGVIALLLAGGLQWAGLIPAPGDRDERAAFQLLREDVDALEQKVAAFDAGTVDAATIGQALAPVDKRIGGLANDLDKMKQDVAAARSAAVSGGSADSAALNDMRDRLAKLEESVAAKSKAAPAVDALGKKVTALGQTAVANSDALKKLEQSVTALSGKVDKQASEPHATAAIAASALKSAIDRGGSFAAELDMFAAIAPDTPELGELQALAAKGVPTRARLASEVGTVADDMLDATRQVASPDGGVVDRLISSARSLVTVRPVGKVEGDGVAARITRFRNAVTGGDLAGAAEEYGALPDKTKAAGADFMAGLQARLKVDALAQKALASALKTG